ncbi:MAG: exodeoxyribonuclease VII large subunit [Verrucomicrobiota bacterium JB023]|nr:exodeoxyribonuclease VII large subunit [Verrucomicrobiota bacterium JB023]
MNLFTAPTLNRDGDQPEAITVTRLLRRMRNVLEIEVGEIWVEGEVSNLRKQSSGHWYFSLKDEGGQLACALFSARRKTGHAVLADGAKVRIFGEVTLYEARGTAQLVVQKAEAAGVGELQARFEALKNKLEKEGLFDPELKKNLPRFPHSIGLVTSGSGAALQDMLNVLSRRAPWVTVHLYDVQVQGKGAEAGIARAVSRLGDWENEGLPECDVIIIGRGGGSLEDLWNFNEEVVARAIAACPIALVSAVGHEIDFTIADFVADLRAPTPSAAAELVVPDGQELQERVRGLRERLQRRLNDDLERKAEVLKFLGRTVLHAKAEDILRAPFTRSDEMEERLERALKDSLRERANSIASLKTRWQANRPAAVLERSVERTGALRERLDLRLANALSKKQSSLDKLAALVRTLGPESAFERGFSITLKEDGSIVRSKDEVEPGSLLKTMVKDGQVSSRVE